LLATTCARALPVSDVIGKSPIRINALEIKSILLAMIYLYVEKRKGGRTPLISLIRQVLHHT
jgi:hypothetical protein